MVRRFQDWIACPDCDDGGEASIMANKTDVVIECYSCGAVDEYVIGDDLPIQNLDLEAIEQVADEG